MSLLQIARFGAEKATAGAVGHLFLVEAVGSALGYATYCALRTIDNYQVEMMLALMMGGTALASALRTSEPLAIVVADLIGGNKSRREGMSDITREYLDRFWELLDELFNAVLFVLIGLAMLVLDSNRTTLLVGLVAIGLKLVTRWASMGLPLALLQRFYSFDRRTLRVLTWGGLRGGISVALALSLPEAGPRDLLVGVTYVVVFSIVVQGITIGPAGDAAGIKHGRAPG